METSHQTQGVSGVNVKPWMPVLELVIVLKAKLISIMMASSQVYHVYQPSFLCNYTVQP